MNEMQQTFPKTGPFELTPIQRQVIDILNAPKSQKYALADWYLGAISTVKNKYNPDRFSQAAQSLRELLEKLPRVFVESEIQESRSGLPDMRRALYSRLCSDKKRYGGVWKGKTIDARLDKTLRGVDHYLELDQLPTRKEQIHSVLNKIDPMHDILDQRIRLEKTERFRSLWNSFQALAHHNTHTDEKAFGEKLALTERLVIDLLAPITAQDQGAIREILSKPHPEQNDVEKLLGLIKRRGANYAYFFKTVDSPIWINPLVENQFFKNPPNVKVAEDGRIITPLWWPIFYLQKIAKQSPEQVVEIILNLEQTDNPRILREILSIACSLKDTSLSLRLKPLIKKFLKSHYRWGEADLIITILKKWGADKEPARNAANEIIQYVIGFQPDPKMDEKLSRRKEAPEAWDSSLEPIPRFEQWEYGQILERGVRPLAKHEPYKLSLILIGAVARLIRLGMHPEEFEKANDQDYSEIWCRRLDKQGHDHRDEKEILVQTLTYACEQVYENASESIDALDQALRNHRGEVFKRLRLHLYASHPTEKTLSWIREHLLGYAEYAKWKYHYEFQLMARKASEHFGPHLLSDKERKGIIDDILSGPPKEDFREWMGERYSEEAFKQRQRHFHRIQLRPFASLISGEVRRYYDELENEAQAEAITDDSYSPYDVGIGGTVGYRSPRSIEDLGGLTDEELLAYLNDWNEEHNDEDNWLVKINIPALAGVFQSLFKEQIVPNEQRLTFWFQNRDRIARPVYVVAILKAILELTKEHIFGYLDKWIEFCKWVLSHPDTTRLEGQPEPRDESRAHPDWGRSRRGVVDFIDACMTEDINAPITVREGLATLLRLACCQYDWQLDLAHPILINRDDPLTEAINNTRSRALASLIYFGFWVRRHLPKAPLPELADILEKRIVTNAELPLTRPEQALLGMHFGNLCSLNPDWAAQHRDIFFPQTNEAIWRDAFGSYIGFNRPVKLTFEILRSEFEYALENLNTLMTKNGDGKELIDRLGQHIFTYYLWEAYPLTGDGSLLERYYEKTKDDRNRWRQLFDHVGRILRNSGKQLGTTLTDRIIAFFDYRFEVADLVELQEFTFWLEAECLTPRWRLQSYSKILDLGLVKDVGLSTQVRAINRQLQDHLALTVECFAKITDLLDKDTHIFIFADNAMPILKAGLEAEDPQIRKNAERARENLLRLGRVEFLDIE